MERTRGGFRSHMWFLIFVVLSSVSVATATDTEPIQKALDPVYTMVRGFIKTVQPNQLNEIKDVLDKWTDKIDKGKDFILVNCLQADRH